MYKYPRTPHIEGSRFQPGDEDLENVPFQEIQNRFVVVEEKVDGANTGISFQENGQLLLQSRGHYLTGGFRERHFDLFKQWASTIASSLWAVLGSRYVLYGEWLYAKHTVFYDYLPHYFLEYDILDIQNQQFLSTECRQKMLADLPIVSVPVLFQGKLLSPKQLAGLLTTSHFIQPAHLQRLKQADESQKLDIERTLRQTDSSELMEGLYIKIEEKNKVTARYKFVRSSFLTTIENSEEHWLNRPIIPNLLQPNINLFTP